MAKKKAASLVIVESPAKARTINKYLGKDYEVTASMGHVRDLPKSKIGIDPEKGFEPAYIVIQKAKKRVTQLKKDAKGRAHIYLATDPDREGEAISWHLAYLLKESKAKVLRVVFNEITKEAILKAFSHPREINQDLVDSQQARRILDRLFGYSLSPLLWKKVGKGLSAGRVQSVALRLIVDREKEIRNFTPEEYWTITARLTKQTPEKEAVFAELSKVKGKKAEVWTERQANEIKTIIEGKPFSVVSLESKKRQRKPQPPYITSKLQQEAYQRFRFTSARTMQIAQRLYEGVDIGGEDTVGLITYMRTDSVHVSGDAQKEARQFISKNFGNDYVPEKPNVFRSKKAAQEAHEAVRPTSVKRTPEEMRSFLTAEELKLYELIWKKFVASQMKGAIEEGTTVCFECAKDYIFKATGTRTLFPGFLAVYQEPKEEDESDEAEKNAKETRSRELPALTKGEILDLESLSPEQHFTKPPARFNDASLVKLLEEKGIGRPSTYAPTIQVIILRNYVERQNNAFMPTSLGEIVTKLLVASFPKLLEPRFTATLEEDLDEIEEGKRVWGQVVSEFYGPFTKQVEKAKTSMKSVKHELEKTDEVCETCGKPMVIRYGRFGRFLACSGFPDCRNTRDLTTKIACPRENCEGKLVKRKNKKGSIFYGCSSFPKCDFITNRLPKPGEKLVGESNNPVPDPEYKKEDEVEGDA